MNDEQQKEEQELKRKRRTNNDKKNKNKENDIEKTRNKNKKKKAKISGASEFELATEILAFREGLDYIRLPKWPHSHEPRGQCSQHLRDCGAVQEEALLDQASCYKKASSMASGHVWYTCTHVYVCYVSILKLHIFIICLSICLSIYLSTYQSICLSLYIYTRIYLSLYISICLSIYVSIYIHMSE